MANGELITDAVLPLAIVAPPENGACAVEALIGTGFIVGNPQRLVTAKHVALLSDRIVGMHAVDGTWITVGFTDRRDHPSEDVSIYTLEPGIECKDWFTLSAEEQYATGEYAVFGYPEEVYHDAPPEGATGRVLPRPDVIYGAGVIRRRVSASIPGVIGASFLELSDTLGLGSSGGPIIAKNRGEAGLRVVGVYVAERTIQMAGRQPRTVAYAVRLASITPWLREQGLQVI